MAPPDQAGGGTVAYRFRHRDGHYIWIQDTFKVVYDEAGQPTRTGRRLGRHHRAQARRAGRAQGQYRAARYQAVPDAALESSTDAIISTDKDGNVVLFNEGAETLLGYRAEEVIGKRPVVALCDSEEQAKDVVREMRKRGGTVAGFESTLESKDGNDIPVLDLGLGSLRRAWRGDRHRWICHRPARAQAGRRGAAESARRAGTARRGTHSRAEGGARAVTVSDDGHARRSCTRTRPSDFTCTFVSENVSRIMGFSAWEMLEDPRLLAVAASSRGRSARLQRNGARWSSKAAARSNTASAIVTGTTSGSRTPSRSSRRTTRANPSKIVGSWADISDRKQAERALGERMAIMNDLQALVGCQPLDHLYDASLGRLRLHFRQRQSEFDHGLRAVGDARRSRSSGSSTCTPTMPSGCSPSSIS